jgi:hypothetical protein
MMTLTGIAASYLFVLLQDLTKKPATNLMGTCSSFDLGRPYMPWCPSHSGAMLRLGAGGMFKPLGQQEAPMNRNMTALTVALIAPVFVFLAAVETASSPAAINEAEAHSVGVDDYLYFNPLVTMELTREQLTNVEPGKEPGRGPMNTFANVPEFPSADFKAVVRPNFNALFDCLARSHQGADDRLRSGHGRALLSSGNARHVERRLRRAGLAHDRDASG